MLPANDPGLGTESFSFERTGLGIRRIIDQHMLLKLVAISKLMIGDTEGCFDPAL